MRSGAAFCGPGRVGDEAGARERVVARHVLEARAVEDGVSEVWHARHVERSSRRATIRIIRPSRDTHLAPAVNAFLSDARAASGLVHRNIVRAYEIGDVEQPFVLGPHAPAVSWAAHVHGGIGAADAIVLLVPLAAALDAAAAAGAAHGAVHPCSILVDNADGRSGGPRALLTGFGLVHLLSAVAARPADCRSLDDFLYVAPELLRGATPTARSDQYSLAAALQHAVTGRPPFVRAHLPALCRCPPVRSPSVAAERRRWYAIGARARSRARSGARQGPRAPVRILSGLHAGGR